MWLESYLKPVTPAHPPVGPLQQGDILVKESDGSATGGVIKFGQWLVSGAGAYAKWAHAGIATSDRMIAEMDGEGLQHHDLAVKNAGYTYSVFRCKFKNVAIGAAETANMMLGFQNNKSGHVTYSIGGAAKSTLLSTGKLSDRNRVNALLDKLLDGQDVSFFCSEHTVYCYVVALEQSGLLPARSRPDLPGLGSFFSYEPGNYSPAYLYEMLVKNNRFDYIGLYKGLRWI
ncbi:hypothetical protein EJV46_17105 [Roseococcus sp. SYP-B2431]|uniref:hypothetical protein n=1 Tax=Roseococcus sp. SYP-B2431 TaxID=2496640 RepID=UPI00103B9FFA|nr:hypothetical protein [Roseococcus sp. SYP-B2431]TCH97040.1 hypothetical protein EJV46_17105 [Roseococcus sp. SYP-B2431]